MQHICCLVPCCYMRVCICAGCSLPWCDGCPWWLEMLFGSPCCAFPSHPREISSPVVKSGVRVVCFSPASLQRTSGAHSAPLALRSAGWCSPLVAPRPLLLTFSPVLLFLTQEMFVCVCESRSPVCPAAVAVQHTWKHALAGRRHCLGTASETEGLVALLCLLARFWLHVVLAVARSPLTWWLWWQQLHNFCVAAYFRKAPLPFPRVTWFRSTVKSLCEGRNPSESIIVLVACDNEKEHRSTCVLCLSIQDCPKLVYKIHAPVRQVFAI